MPLDCLKIKKMKTYNTTPFDWFNYVAQDNNSNALIQFVLKTDNNIDFELLKKALQNCIIADPIIGCIFQIEDIMPQWIETIVKIDDLCKNIQTESVNETVKACLGEKLDAHKECSVKLFLIQSKQGSTLVIKTHHAMSDAVGSLQFVRLLCDMYSKLEVNPDFVPEESLPKRGTEDFYLHFGVIDKKAAFNPALLPKKKSSWGTPFDDTKSEQSFEYQTLRFNEKELSHIIDFAKANDSSLNALLTAAYHSALCKIIKPTDELKEVQFSANLRPYAESLVPNTICNFSNIFNIDLPTQGSFVESMKLAKQNINKAIEPERVLQIVLVCELMSPAFKHLAFGYHADWENIQKTGYCTPMISNIGRLDNDSLYFGSLSITDLHLVPPAFISPSFMLSVSTYHNVMTLCIAYQKPSMNDDFVSTLLKSMKEIMTF
jgi:Uncharacterized protein containing a NRPS condensation (elongation) domain